MARDALLYDFVGKTLQLCICIFLHLANIIWHKYLNVYFMEGSDTFNQAIQ